MTHWRIIGSVILVTSCGLAAFAADPPTDGLVWKKGYPLSVAAPSGKTPITVAGTVDTAKYKNIKITSNVAYWKSVEIKNGKEVAGSTHTFKLNLYKDNTPPAWDGGSTNEIVGGQPMPFAGFGPGTYKVTVEIKVKETPTSEERSAIITGTVVIAEPTTPPVEEEPPVVPEGSSSK